MTVAGVIYSYLEYMTLAKDKGVAARLGLKEVRSKALARRTAPYAEPHVRWRENHGREGS